MGRFFVELNFICPHFLCSTWPYSIEIATTWLRRAQTISSKDLNPAPMQPCMKPMHAAAKLIICIALLCAMLAAAKPASKWQSVDWDALDAGLSPPVPVSVESTPLTIQAFAEWQQDDEPEELETEDQALLRQMDAARKKHDEMAQAMDV